MRSALRLSSPAPEFAAACSMSWRILSRTMAMRRSISGSESELPLLIGCSPHVTTICSVPSPLVGEGQGGGSSGNHASATPTPTPPHKGEGNRQAIGRPILQRFVAVAHLVGVDIDLAAHIQ